MSEDFRDALSGDPLNDAALWHQRLQRTDADEPIWIAFTDWLEADDRHRLAYDKVEALYDVLGGLDSSTIVQLPRNRRPMLPWLAGAGLTAAAASVLVALALRPAPPIIEHIVTAPGETRHVVAADGSAFDLNGATSLAIALSPRLRQVQLEHGEALFHVAADPRRPFVVAAGSTEIRDIGTVFDVVQMNGLTTVSVAEGKVSVSTPGSASKPILVSAGERLEQSDGGVAVRRPIDPASASSWVSGYLVYEEASLSQVVADVGRYGPRKIVVQGPDSSFRRFSGILKIDSEDAMLDRLGQLLPLSIDRAGDGPVTVRAASPAK